MAVCVAHAMRRAAISRTATSHDIDFLAIDWFDLADLPVGDVRGLFRVVPKSDEAVAAGSVGPFEAGGISEFQDRHGREIAAAEGRPYDSYGASPSTA